MKSNYALVYKILLRLNTFERASKVGQLKNFIAVIKLKLKLFGTMSFIISTLYAGTFLFDRTAHFLPADIQIL